jgi:ApbE superfamily uncharacterized protein (UPF0280 family)
MLSAGDMESFAVAVKETDLWISVEKSALDTGLPGRVEQYLWQERRLLEKYIEERDPVFAQTLVPHLLKEGAPPIALEMVRAGNLAGVGPMAAVAGAFAQYVGKWLLRETSQVIVENGGDIFLCCKRPVRVGIYAGESVFSRRLALKVEPRGEYRGICTSSGTVGPSYSSGRADAAVIIAGNAALADAVATAAGNMVQNGDDLQKALDFACSIPGVRGGLIILGDKLVAGGEIQLEEY